MFKFSHRALVIISGLIWMGVGCFLLQLGLKLLLSAVKNPIGSYPIISSLTNFVEINSAIIVLVAIALFIGHFKGKYVLGKSVKRGVVRILSFPNPTQLSNIYSAKYYLLLGLMVCLGLSIKFFGLANDVRGFVDVAIGAALINGALIYFKMAFSLKQSEA